MIQEFKDFIMRGNVLELAIAVIIAGAFGAVVTSFTNDIVLPPIGLAMGGMDFSQLEFVLQEGVVNGETVVSEKVAIRYGAWLKTIIDFVIIAFILFMIIKGYNKANPPVVETPKPTGPTQEELLAQIRDLLKNR